MTQSQMDRGPGQFGPQTQASTIASQRARGLNVSGRVGVATQAKMTKVSATGAPAPAPAAGKVRVRNISQLFSNGSEDNWSRNSNCGPASVAMIANAFGLRPAGWSDGKLVNWIGGEAGVGASGAGW